MNRSTYIFLDSFLKEFKKQIETNISLPNAAIILNNYLQELETPSNLPIEQNKKWGLTKSQKKLSSIINLLLEKTIEGNKQSLIEAIELIQKNDLKQPKNWNIVFFTQEFSLWPSFSSIYDEFTNDNNCNTILSYQLLYASEQDKSVYNSNLKAYKDNNLNILEKNQIDLIKESPDIAFYMKPYNFMDKKYYLNSIKDIIEYNVFISYCLDCQGGEALIRYQYKLPFFYHVWKIISYSDYYTQNMKKWSFRNNNIKQIGHPKYDQLHQLLSSKYSIRKDWKNKIAGRPTVLWNTHFSVKQKQGVGSFFEWGKIIIDFFKNNTELVLIWRPHPFFMKNMLEVLGEKDYQKFSLELQELEKRNNIILDNFFEITDYKDSFLASDALISDATSFLLEFNITKNPILYTPKTDGEGVSQEEFLDFLYVANSENDIANFLNNVNSQYDPMKNKRLQWFNNEMGNIDGSFGSQIKTYVISEIEKEEKNKAKNLINQMIQESR